MPSVASGHLPPVRGYYAESIAHGEVRLAFCDDELVGTVRVLLREPIAWPDVVDDDGVYAFNLAVRRHWASREIGRRLLDWVAGSRRTRLQLVCTQALIAFDPDRQRRA